MRVLAVTLVATLLAACGGSAGSSTSGIRGHAFVSPVCPVEPCPSPSPPYTGIFVVRQAGKVVANARTDGQGYFEIRLVPGHYTLESLEGRFLPSLKPVQVTVRDGEFTEVELRFDSGIR
ncbi:MAG TPA: carboxypeptidase-like regulatory domain-containing protein [Gaiellaceae bacterium]|nr:carboxypeptidase-like regulatory domain-containing protein [Gaiellaceae bacterium]